MPSFSLSKKTLSYGIGDEAVIERAITLLGCMSEYDAGAKQDATSGLVALKHLQEHVAKQRNAAKTTKPATAAQ